MIGTTWCATRGVGGGVGGWGTPYNGLYGKAPPKRVQVYERARISQVEAYERVRKSVIADCERTYKG